MRNFLLVLALSALPGCAQKVLGIEARVDFSRHLRDWDGFGVNYVQVAQTRDYQADPQEYGGFSLLTEQQRKEIIGLIFGADGLKPGLLKMFLDPYHEAANDNGDPNLINEAGFDHQTTTGWLRYFAREGLAATRGWGGDLSIITTLYGPPAWCTRQKFVRGRDLDPAMKYEVSEYIIAWTRYLRQVEKLPVNFIAFHNEGEDWMRWPPDGSGAGAPNHDFNMYWPPEQVVDFIKFTRGMLDRQGLQAVGIAPGETTNWTRFHEWGYAAAIAGDPAAVKALGLITSHGFINFDAGRRWFGDWRSAGPDMIREKKPSLHAWVTSQSWSKMDVHFLNQIRGNIYATKVNGIIPWAAVQRPAQWTGGDPNPGCAINIDEQGNYLVRPGYYWYKQVSRAGQPGMAVAEVAVNDAEAGLIAFARKSTNNPDAFVVLNLSGSEKPMTIRIAGSPARSFRAFRSSPGEQYAAAGSFALDGGAIAYTAPPSSATTFFAAR